MAVKPQVLPYGVFHHAQDSISLHFVGGEVVGRASALPTQVESAALGGSKGSRGHGRIKGGFV